MSIGKALVALAVLGVCVWLYVEGRVTGMQAIGLAFLGAVWVELVN